MYRFPVVADGDAPGASGVAVVAGLAETVVVLLVLGMAHPLE
jgi:hypothetical protein